MPVLGRSSDNLAEDMRWAAGFLRRELPSSARALARADRLDAGAGRLEQIACLERQWRREAYDGGALRRAIGGYRDE